MASGETHDSEASGEVEFIISSNKDSRKISGKEKESIVRKVQDTFEHSKKGNSKLVNLQELFNRECPGVKLLRRAEFSTGSFRLHFSFTSLNSLVSFKSKKSDGDFLKQMKETIFDAAFERSKSITITLRVNVEKKALASVGRYFASDRQEGDVNKISRVQSPSVNSRVSNKGEQTSQQITISDGISLENQGELRSATIASNLTIEGPKYYVSSPEGLSTSQGDTALLPIKDGLNNTNINNTGTFHYLQYKSSGNDFLLEVQLLLNVLKNKNIHPSERDRISALVENCVSQKLRAKKTEDLLREALNEYRTVPSAVFFSSIWLQVAFVNQENLEVFWKGYKDGSICSLLREALLTPDITDQFEEEISLQIRVPEEMFAKGVKFFTNRKEETFRKPTSQWSENDVYEWIKDEIQLVDVAEMMRSEGVDGETLLLYEIKHLCNDFGLKKGPARKILYKFGQHSYGALASPVPSVGSLETSENDLFDVGNPLKALNTKSQVESSSELRITELKPSAVKSDNITDKVTVHDPSAGIPNLTTSRNCDDMADEECLAQGVEAGQIESDLDSRTEELKPIAVRSNSDSGQASPILSNTLTGSLSSETSKDYQGVSDIRNIMQVEETGSQTEIGAETRKQGLKPNTLENDPQTPKISLNQRLNKLVVGDKKGQLTNSFFPILVVNKIPEKIFSNPGIMDETLSFLGDVEWTAVFDCDADSAQDGGLCSFIENKRKVKKLTPETFKEIGDIKEFQADLGFPVETPWIFCNGRTDINTPELNRRDWSKERKKDVQDAISFFTNSMVIPNGRERVLVFLLSDDSVGIMADIWSLLYSALRGEERITCFCENDSSFNEFCVKAKDWIGNSELKQRSMVGYDWASIQQAMVKLARLPKRSKCSLPLTGGDGKMKSYNLNPRKVTEWTDLEILLLNECEDENLEENSYEFEEKKMNEELHFYRGNKVIWWNFALSDKRYNNRKGYNQVLKRQCQRRLNEIVSKCLSCSGGAKNNTISTVTVFHEPGSGGSTVARQSLWNFHQTFRCCIVREVTENSVNQILEFRALGYNSERDNCPPVLVLLEDSDPQETTYLLEEMEHVSKEMSTAGPVCVFLHCRRTSSPEIDVIEDFNDLSVAVTHKLDQFEKKWFHKKFEELESKTDGNEMYEPEKLLAFMVMKEECSENYLQNVVHKLLQDMKMKNFNYEKELKLVKYIALMTVYNENFVMPVSCCDQMMSSLPNMSKHRKSFRQIQVKPWEEVLSPACKLLLTKENSRNSYGKFVAHRIVHALLAKTILEQILAKDTQDIAEAMTELLRSTILSKKVFISKYVLEKVREVITRRKKIDYGDEVQTDFSPLIEDINKLSKEKAISLLQVASEVLEGPFVGLQLARFHQKQKNFQEAHTEIDECLKKSDSNPFILDTKGNIYRQQIQTEYEEKYRKRKGNLSIGKACGLIKLSFDAMDVFKKSQDILEKQKLQYFYGVGNVVKVLVTMIEILLCSVHPFSETRKGKECLQGYILDRAVPREVREMWSAYHEKFFEIPLRVSETIQVLQELRTYTKSGSNSIQARRTSENLLKTFNDLCAYQVKYFSRDSLHTPQDELKIDPESLSELRRSEATRYGAIGFHKIFEFAVIKKYNELVITRDILLKNGDYMNYMDLLSVIMISLALAPIETDENCMPEEEAFQLVMRLNFKKDNIFSNFLKMMFLWPRRGSAVFQRDDKELLTTILDLKTRWHKEIDFRQNTLDEEEHPKKHLKLYRKRRAQTFFFLGVGKGLKSFVHVNELNIGEKQLEKPKAQFWKSDLVTQRLRRLEGKVLNSTQILYTTEHGKTVRIKQAPSWSGIPSQDDVDFYLGFSFEGPLAFNVTNKDKESAPTKIYTSAYPSYLSENPHGKLKKLQAQRALLCRDRAGRKNESVEEKIKKIDEKIKHWRVVTRSISQSLDN